jgi:hypothetical protein
VAAYFFESLTMNCTVVAAPGTEAASNSPDWTRFQASLARMGPVRERQGSGPVGGRRQIVAQNGAKLVQGVRFQRRCHQFPVPIPVGDGDPVDRRRARGDRAPGGQHRHSGGDHRGGQRREQPIAAWNLPRAHQRPRSDNEG